MRALNMIIAAGIFALAGATAAQSADPVKIRLSWVAPVTNWASIMLEKRTWRSISAPRTRWSPYATPARRRW